MKNLLMLHSLPVATETTDFRLTSDEMHNLRSKSLKNNNPEGLATVTETCFLFDDPRFNRIKEFMQDHIDDYVANILEIENKMVLTTSWCAVNKPGSHHPKHDHKNTILSIVYYADCESGDLVLDFKNSRLEERFNFSYNIKRYNEFNSNQWILPLRTGDIIIFPGWVDHYTQDNKSDKERIVIGANYFIRGQLGTKWDVSYLEV